jgi:hypothetical protein
MTFAGDKLNVDGDGAEFDALLVGTAAEYLVCFDLMMRGYPAFRADQGFPYDAVVQVPGRLLRLQIKSTLKTRRFYQSRGHIEGYAWQTRRGRRGVRTYDPNTYDAMAFVALDIKEIAYLPAAEVRQGFSLPISGHRKSARKFADYSFEKLLETINAVRLL